MAESMQRIENIGGNIQQTCFIWGSS